MANTGCKHAFITGTNDVAIPCSGVIQACNVRDLVQAAPALLEALEAVTAFAFSDVQAKEGYQAALKAFCSLKRKGRAAIALAREEK